MADLMLVGKKPVDAGDAHVVQAGDPVPEGFGRLRGLLGHRYVAGSARGHDDRPLPVRKRIFSDGPHPAQGIIGQGKRPADKGGRLRGHTGDQDSLLAVGAEILRDPQDLFRCLAGAVDHLGYALPHGPVQVCLGISEIVVGDLPQLQGCLLRRNASGSNLIEQALQFFFVFHLCPGLSVSNLP